MIDEARQRLAQAGLILLASAATDNPSAAEALRSSAACISAINDRLAELARAAVQMQPGHELEQENQ